MLRLHTNYDMMDLMPEWTINKSSVDLETLDTAIFKDLFLVGNIKMIW